MTTENQQLIRELWSQIWIEGDLDRLSALLTDPYIRHTRDGTVTASPAAYARHLHSAVQMFRGTELTFASIDSIDDKVFARLNLDGVNLETGNSVRLTWLAHYRIVDGLVAESWTMHQSDIDW